MLQTQKYSTQLIIFSSLVLAGIGFGAIAVIWWAQAGLGLSPTELTALSVDPSSEQIEVLKWMNNIAQIFGFYFPVLLFLQMFGKQSVNGLMLRKPSNWIWLAPLVIIASNGLIEWTQQINIWLIPEGSVLETWFKPSEEHSEILTTKILSGTGWWSMMNTLFSVALIPAVGEELVFRGVVQPLLAKSTQSIHFAIWGAAFLFSFIHFQFYGFLPRLLLGAILGYLVIWTGSLWASIIGHMFNNFLAIIIFKLNGNSLDTPDMSDTWIWITYIASALITAGLMLLIYRKSQWPWSGFAYMGITHPPKEHEQSSDPLGS
jgi:membrane protease YdiL (CAAX protease family)